MSDKQNPRYDAAREVDEATGFGVSDETTLETRTGSSEAGRETFDTDAEQGVIRVPLKEEMLEAHTVPTQLGSVLFHKRIEEHPVVEDVDLRQDDVSVDRVDAEEFVEAREEPWYEGDTLVIPVYEERIVSETRLVLRQYLRVNRTQRIETVSVQGNVRREVVEVEPVVNDEGTVADVEPIVDDQR